ncbi:MAG: AAA family ATPase, partial [Oscillospiraceae bacterium]|nr:AAA family ATPase [Oscillospiraceae bacterium]
MKEIKIMRLALENFKCHRRLDLVLGGRSTAIYGDNATGKTSIYDALTCLLFGKDSSGKVAGEKGVNIKPLDANGEVKDHQAVTSVEGEFLVDGETVTLRRTYQEIWTTRRGSSEAVYDGDTTGYYVDGVPMKKNAFDARVRELVPEELFRMLTSVSYFASDMKWQER